MLAPTAAGSGDLGIKNVKLYDSPWLGCSAVFSAPAADEVILDVGALNSTIRSLEQAHAEKRQ